VANLIEICEGVPRKYPFNKVLIIIDKIDWHKTGILNKPTFRGDAPIYLFHFPKYMSSHIMISSDWWISHRNNSIYAKLEIDPPPNEAMYINDINENLLNTLNQLGKIQTQEFIAIPSSEELPFIKAANEKAILIIKDYEENIEKIISGISLPFSLHEEPWKRDYTYKKQTVSGKKAIINAFKPKGYMYYPNYSGQGGYFLSKRIQSNHQLELHFDLGSPQYNNKIYSYLTFRGPYYVHHLPLIAVANKRAEDYRFNDQEELEKVVANLAAVVDHLENSIITDLEKIYEHLKVPLWYDYQS
jgi:hypothetical protein